MPPPMQQRFGGANNIPQYQQQQQYPVHSQAGAGLPPPAFGGATAHAAHNQHTQFMNTSTMSNPFSNNNALGMSGTGFGSGLNMQGGTGLASHAAQMSFAAASNQHRGNNGTADTGSGGPAKTRIREVWRHNMEDEMALLRKLVDKYQYISMDTEFPGVVARPMGSFQSKSDYHYQTLRCNVDLLKVIQIGITLFNEEGKEIPDQIENLEEDLQPLMRGDARRNGIGTPLPCTWQFNFKFSLKEDMYAENSIESLRAAGLDFAAIERDGIEPTAFAALLISSGLVCDEQVHWVSFHGGYDFGYLTKLLTCLPLPDEERQFDIIMKKYFPSIWDIKFLMKHAIRQRTIGGNITPLDSATTEVLARFEQKASLEGVMESFKIKRIGKAHSAGSDSLVTGRVFFRMREKVFNDELQADHLGRVWGLGYPESGPIPQQFSQNTGTPQHQHIQHQQQDVTTTPGGNPYSNGAPSTPITSNVGLVSTPAHIAVPGPHTPGGGGMSFGGGAFGGFMANNGR